MKTWNQFLESKYNEANAQLAPMGQQPPQYQVGFKPNYKPARQSVQPGQQTRQPAPVSDEETGQQYAKSMQIQQAMAQQPNRRRV